MKEIKKNNRPLDKNELYHVKRGFCALDICVDLKRLGFDDACMGHRSYRYPESNPSWSALTRNSNFSQVDPYCGEEVMLCSFPFMSQAQKWLREKWNIFLTAELVFNTSKHEPGEPYSAWSYYRWKAYRLNDCDLEYVVYGEEDLSYEEALDHGLRSCLDDVIETMSLINFTGVIQTAE